VSEQANAPLAQAPGTLLSGIRVLDLSRVLAGPWATQLLADQGACVLKIERAGSGDDTRSWGPPWWKADTSSYFTCANRGKTSLAADFKNPDHLRRLRELAHEADVLIENFKVGQLKAYGLDAETLQATHPGLIYCSITGFGQTGPRASEAGYDFALQGFTGLMSITGTPDGEPQKVGVAIIDLVTGVYAAQAICAALVARARTGRGAMLDCSLMDAGLSILANQASGFLAAQRVPHAMGNAHPSIVPYQVYRAQDGFLALAVGNDGQFAAMAAAMGHAQWSRDARFESNPARVANRDVLNGMLEPLFASRPRSHWLALFAPAGVPCTPVQRVDEVFSDAQVLQRSQVVLHSDTQLRTLASPVVVNGVRGVHPRSPGPVGPLVTDVRDPWIESTQSL